MDNLLHKGFEEMFQETKDIAICQLENYLSIKNWNLLKILRYIDWHRKRLHTQQQIDAQTKKRINQFTN